MPSAISYPARKPILLNLPLSLVEQLDTAAGVLNFTRTDLIRRSLSRDLRFVFLHEVPRARQFKEETATRYAAWLAGRTGKP